MPTRSRGPAPQARRAEQAGEFKSYRNYVALPRSRGVPHRVLGARRSQAPADAAGAGIQPQDRRRGRRRQRHRPRSGAAAREARRPRRRRRPERRQRRSGRQGSRGAFVAGAGAGRGARPQLARQHRRGVPRDGHAVRRPRRRDQHRGDLPDAGAGHAARADVGPDDEHQRHQQPRARRRSGEDPEGAGPARLDRAHQLGQRGRAEGRQRGRTTSARRRSTT